MLLLLAALACAPTPSGDEDDVGGGDGPRDTQPGDTALTPTDADGDGFFSEATGGDDCDDTNPDVSPAALEDCNTYDDDCDGAVDESGVSARPFYADDDGDGYGDLYQKTTACNAPTGYVDNSDDCDDTDAAINPAGQEVCDDANDDEDCDGLVNANDDSAQGTVTMYPDIDNDGYGNGEEPTERCGGGGLYVDNDDDCDDQDDDVHPGATEECNGIDDDCDGRYDEGTGTDLFWADADGDGYGDPDSPIESCLAPEGYVSNYGDCDDSEPTAYPGATERCDPDDIDEDCDGYADDDDSSATGKTTFYEDLDGDGYGTTAATTLACDAPEGYAAIATDCDDTDASVSPGALEGCAEGDDDCDGLVDEADPSFSGGSTWYRDGDSDGYGDPTTSTESCDAPAGYVSNSGDCDDGDSTVNPAATEACSDGIDNDCDGTDAICGYVSGTYDAEDDAGAAFYGTSTDDGMGTAACFAGDPNGDGIDDVLVGAPYRADGGTDAGALYVFYGPSSGTVAASSASVVYVGADDGDLAGWSAAALGDFGGDSRDDIAIGAPGDGSSEGVAYVLTSLASGTLGASGVVLTGEAAGDKAGYAVAGAGDIDDDRDEDLLVGAPYNDEVGSNSGRAYLVLGGSSSTRLDSADAIIDGEAAGDLLGFSVSAAGDIDGDGNDDFALGGPGNDRAGTYAGRAYLFLGPLAGNVDADDGDALLDGTASGDQAGSALAGGFDVDDDGDDDLCVGMPAYDGGGTNSGGIAILLGDFSGSIGLEDADILVIGENPGDQVGYAVSTGGDVDDDGNTDLFVGSFSSDRGASNGGTAFLLYGPLAGGSVSLSSSDAFFMGTEAGAYVGWPVSGGGDHDGNGSDDLLLGARYSGVGARDAGAAFLYYAGL